MNAIREDVAFCARCGCDHREMEFAAFRRPVRIGALDITDPRQYVYTHWALCPHTQEPILRRDEEVE